MNTYKHATKIGITKSKETFFLSLCGLVMSKKHDGLFEPLYRDFNQKLLRDYKHPRAGMSFISSFLCLVYNLRNKSTTRPAESRLLGSKELRELDTFSTDEAYRMIMGIVRNTKSDAVVLQYIKVLYKALKITDPTCKLVLTNLVKYERLSEDDTTRLHKKLANKISLLAHGSVDAVITFQMYRQLNDAIKQAKHTNHQNTKDTVEPMSVADKAILGLGSIYGIKKGWEFGSNLGMFKPSSFRKSYNNVKHRGGDDF